MKDIYSTAFGTLVWLGEEKENDRAAVAKVLEVARYVSEHVDDLTQKGDPDKYQQFEGFHSLVASDKDYGKGLIDFCRRDWWQRIWIVQEACLSNLNLGFFSGTQAITSPQLWATLLPAYAQLERDAGDMFKARSSALQRVPGVMTLLNLKMDYHKGFKRPLLWLLDITRDHYATDPKDKIYGLLGMSSDYSSEELIPNYHRTVNEVYLDLVEAHLARYGSLHILNFCEPQRAREAGLPSWAPNWARDEGRKESPLAYAYIPDAE